MNNESQNTCIVELKDVTKVYGSNGVQTTAVKDVSLKSYLGELLLLMGPSGSGKTTLLTLIAGLIEPTFGKVSVLGRSIEEYSEKELQNLRANKIGFLFQDFKLIDSLTIAENINLVLKFSRRNYKNSKQHIINLLQKFNLAQLAPRYPANLSHGEKQRAAFVRAIANDAEIIIADEPTASLESKQGFEIVQRLHNYAKNRNKCVIVASHDLRIVELADRVLRLEDGVVHWIK